MRRSRLSIIPLLLPVAGTFILIVSSALPLLWLIWQVIRNPAVLRLLQPGAIRWDILLRTCGFSLIAAFFATLLALPVGLFVGLRRGAVARLIAFLLPLTLLLPSLTYAYGWAQCFRLLELPLGRLLTAAGVAQHWLQWSGVAVIARPDGPRAYLSPAGLADVARCIFSLAAWLWPIPAAAIAWSLRRADPSVQQQALLDGAAGRVMLRQAFAPALVGAMAVWVLATQEFAVYEPTGVSVVATEVRMVFETGSFSSSANPITAPMGGTFGGDGPVDASPLPSATAPSPMLSMPSDPQDVQQRAAAAAVATGVPMLILTSLVGVVVAIACRRWAAAGDDIHDAAPVMPGSQSSARRAKPLLLAATLFVVLFTVGVPVGAMILRHQRRFNIAFIWKQSGELVLGSLLIAALAGLAAAVLALLATQRRPRWAVALALATFLVGGQLLAIALIRLYNRPHLGWVYNAPPIMMMAYLGRFGWLALLAAGATWSRPWQRLRQQAQMDGADAGAISRYIVWPLAWPLLLGAALLVLVLSLTEVPATVLAAPYRPPQIVPMLMTWVHNLDNDPMIEASLLLGMVVVGISTVSVALVHFGRRRSGTIRQGFTATTGSGRRLMLALLLLWPFASAVGCGDPNQPDAVWMTTGTAPGQVVYPRAITYSAADDTFFIIDRVARVQHLDRDGKYLNGWQMPDFHFGKPVGVSVGPDGNVYIPDTHYHRVMVYSPQGQLVRQWGTLGKGPGEFIFPTDVAFDEQGRIFVSEYGEHDRIQVFDKEAKFLFEFGKFGEADGEFSRPQSILIDKGLVYVSDSCNHRIVIFKTDGTFVRNIGSVGSELGQFRFPYGMAFDPDGRLIVCEFGNNRVQLIDKETGKGLKTWGAAGRDPGQLAYPWGVAADKKGRVVTIDSGNNRLQVFAF